MRTSNDCHVTDVLDVMRATGCLLVHSGGDLIPFFFFFCTFYKKFGMRCTLNVYDKLNVLM